jgi:(2Fe-2S) ferredoxin
LNLPFKHHILICTGPRCGGERGSNRVRQEFRKEFVRQGLPPSVKDTQCICFGLCRYGPNVIVYPEGVVYANVTPRDVAAIVREHLVGGRIVERLLLRRAPAAPGGGEADGGTPGSGDDGTGAGDAGGGGAGDPGPPVSPL